MKQRAKSATRSISVKAYWDSEKSAVHREKVSHGMKKFWSRVKR